MRRLRRVKILATLGPASQDPAVLARLFEAGVDVFRINMSHASHDAMRERIKDMRTKLHQVLRARVPGRNFDYFLTQRGMFSYTGLSAGQVDRLREEHAVYLVRSGRMCVAGLNTGNVQAVADAMAAVLA